MRADDDGVGSRETVLDGSTWFLGVFESFLPTAGPFRIGGTGSIGEDVFVVRHRGGLYRELAVVEDGGIVAGGSGRWGFGYLAPPSRRRRGPGQGEGGGSTPEIEVAQDPFNDGWVLDESDEAHSLPAFRTPEWIGMPRLPNEVPPLAGG